MGNERYLGLIGCCVGKFWVGIGYWSSKGSPVHVAFDPKVVMDREEKEGDIVGFFHTHPGMSSRPSNLDYRTMGAWVNSFGKPLVAVIEGRNGVEGHWFVDDEREHITGWVKKYGKIFVGKIPRKVRKFIKEKHHGK